MSKIREKTDVRAHAGSWLQEGENLSCIGVELVNPVFLASWHESDESKRTRLDDLTTKLLFVY